MSRSSSPDDIVAEPTHSRLEDGPTLDRVTFRATDEQLAALESLVDDGVYHSRSEALRAGVRQLLERHRRLEPDDESRDGSASE
ncbi:putative transcriptional regulator, CopG family [Haloterrigena turkmenica DSM 5511]|uniref:Transcriptional regulator, CopG family n=1 Tax=Haloterrigena turkmenica (strain ATCC 51198 / DSM 5511 / JCM 9101 / NCIMB 13204 / VKM B-1734 / 4k) TaxID=543526 RepID=D2RT25_HALTV|nr:ribbon-helix-helix domain-containing protein [Haloterrigena turkmenica]ADB60905.1 putative transcriptional regulator, CopG family [Haloterrigena turkmenica DSM 5511]